MNNKYFYLFFKDALFQMVCVLSVVGVVSSLVLIQLSVGASLTLKDTQVKQAIIDHIPVWQAKLVKAKVVVVVEHSNLTLNGIILNNDRPMAIINNTIVKLGGKIQDKKVVMITKHSATLCDIGAADKCIKLLLEK